MTFSAQNGGNLLIAGSNVVLTGNTYVTADHANPAWATATATMTLKDVTITGNGTITKDVDGSLLINSQNTKTFTGLIKVTKGRISVGTSTTLPGKIVVTPPASSTPKALAIGTKTGTGGESVDVAGGDIQNDPATETDVTMGSTWAPEFVNGGTYDVESPITNQYGSIVKDTVFAPGELTSSVVNVAAGATVDLGSDTRTYGGFLGDPSKDNPVSPLVGDAGDSLFRIESGGQVSVKGGLSGDFEPGPLDRNRSFTVVVDPVANQTTQFGSYVAMGGSVAKQGAGTAVLVPGFVMEDPIDAQGLRGVTLGPGTLEVDAGTLRLGTPVTVYSTPQYGPFVASGATLDLADQTMNVPTAQVVFANGSTLATTVGPQGAGELVAGTNGYGGQVILNGATLAITPGPGVTRGVPFTIVHGRQITGTFNLTRPDGSTNPIGDGEVVLGTDGKTPFVVQYSKSNGSVTDVKVTDIAKPDTSTSLSGPSAPVAAAADVALTATVTGATADGAVSFDETTPGGTVHLGSANLSGGTAVFHTSSLTPGTHKITASYQGDAGAGTSTSSAVTVTVNPNVTTLMLTGPNGKVVAGLGVPLSATVAPTGTPGSVPTGQVTFMEGLTVLGTVNLDGTGTASFTTPGFVGGSSHTITAVYSGDPTFAGTTAVFSPIVVTGRPTNRR
jgi:hypothetical protein